MRGGVSCYFGEGKGAADGAVADLQLGIQVGNATRSILSSSSLEAQQDPIPQLQLSFSWVSLSFHACCKGALA